MIRAALKNPHLVAVLALTLVVLGTWAGREMPPPVTETTLKRLAFGLLLLLGVWILATAW